MPQRSNGFRRLAAIVQQRCPRCLHGQVFATLFRMHEQCPLCGLSFEREPGYFTGAMYLMECPRIVSTDLDGLTCKTPLVVGAPGVAAQRITSSAWKRSVEGSVRPMALAVLTFTTNSNLLGRSMGKSPTLAPLRILSM
jgi:hypothetical protein